MQYKKEYKDVTNAITIQLEKDWRITVCCVTNNMNNS